MDLPKIHEQALAATRALVAGVKRDQFSLPTPCDDWDVRTLLNHIVSGNFWVAELATGGTIEAVGDRLDGDVLGADALAAYDASARAAADAFNAPGAMQAPCAVSYGPVPGEVYCGHRILDVVIHGWDLAVGTAQNTLIDPSLVDAVAEIVEPQLEMIVGSGAFGTLVELDSTVDAQTRLLAQLGRSAR